MSARYEPGVTLWKTKVLRADMGAEKALPSVDSVACVEAGSVKGLGTGGRYRVMEAVRAGAARAGTARAGKRIAARLW